MLSRKEIVIDASDFVKGMSQSDDVNDAGFSPTTDAVNLIASPGVMHCPANVTDKSTNLSGAAIAHTPGIASVQGNGFLLADDGKILFIDTAQALTASSALGGTWTTGTSDISQFIDKIYATSSTDVARMDTDLTNGDHDWWSNTLGKGVLVAGMRHPLLQFIGYLFVGDGSALHRIESSAAGTKNHLLLTAENSITALGIDQGTGQMLIATTVGSNYSGTIATENRIYVYNGVEPTPSRKVDVDGMVTGFRCVGGITYIAYGNGKLGYWNGSGVTFLRKLKNVTLAGADLAYKHHLTNIDNTLYVVDGKQILAYGEVLAGGPKVFYYALSNNINTNKYSLVCPVGDGKIGVGFATTKFYTFDPMSIASAAAQDFTTNKISFPRPVTIVDIYIEYANAVVSNDNNRNLSYKTEEQGFGFTLMRDPTASFSLLKNSSASSVYSQFFNKIGILRNKVRNLQLRYSVGSANSGLRRIVVGYIPAE